jgi:hypothetical protein
VRALVAFGEGGAGGPTFAPRGRFTLSLADPNHATRADERPSCTQPTQSKATAPSLAAIQQLRGQTTYSGTIQPAIATKWTAAAVVTSVWKISWKPNVAGHGSGRLSA